MLFIALAILGLSINSVISFPFSSLVVLGSAVLVAAFVNQYQLRLPKAQIDFPAANIFAFWGIFWLGPGGGLILGAAAMMVGFALKRKENRPEFFSVYTGIVSMAASALGFYLLFGYIAGAEREISGLDMSATKIVIAGTLLMAGIHFLVSSSLLSIFDRLESDLTTAELLKKQFFQPVIGSILAAFATIVLCLLFSHFGLEFGLVIAPIAVISNLAYRIHVKRLEQKTKQILDASRVHLATVEALATAIDARDQVGLGHVRRTQILAIGLGEILGLHEDEINALRTGALLHDIGKLAVPDHILNKPDRLTAAELEKTKIHASVGALILERVGFQHPVVPTVKHHHECWDGSGYPEQLKGEEIPLTARILSIADAYDTLRGARPYRPSIPRDKARKIILDGAETRFDPNIVKVFIKNLFVFEAEIDAQGLSYTNEDNVDLAKNAIGGETYVDQIKLANREVFSLYELAREFSSSVNLQETLELFTQKVGEFVPFTTCAVYLLDAPKKVATAIHVDGEHRDLLALRRIRVGQGATGYALKKLETVQNVDPDLDFSFSHVELTHHYSTMASVPLIADDELIGAISIYSSEITKYGEENIRLLETIARIAADAIGKSLQHDEAKAHAMTDPMTGLPNARSLQIQFEKEVGRASRAGSSFQLLMLDLDGFKAVNDSFGHKIGDELLKGVGGVIRGQLRDYDFLARYGGDEFVALIPETNPGDVLDLCSRIEKAVAEFALYVDDNRFASVGVSLGASGYPKNGETFDQMIVAADKAMYKRKTTRKIIDPVAADERLRPSLGLSAEHHSAQNGHEYDLGERISKDGFIVELDESHVISSAIN